MSLLRVPLLAVLVLGLAAVAEATPVAAQDRGTDEVRLLEAASEREQAGDLEAAEARLREVLAARPASVPAVLALERVLRIQGKLDALPPLVTRALEEDPESALLNRQLVRTYSELNRVEALDRAAERWIETVPALEIAYREVAQVWAERDEYGRARAVLEEGRERTGRPDALALELGDLYARIGEPSAAVREWARSVERDGRGLSQVRRRLNGLPHGGREVVGELVDLLAADPAAPGRVDAALELAVDARLEERARALAESRLPALPPRERRRWLDRLARQADAAGLSALAYWGYGALLAAEADGAVEGRQEEDGRLMALRQRQAELALELGDTAAAAAAVNSMAGVEDSLDRGSARRQDAAATRIELLAGQEPDRAREALDRFRSEHGDSPDLDRLTAVVAQAFLEQGREPEAERVLTDAGGPRSTLLRAQLLLANGHVQAARSAYMSAAPGIRGAEATRVLALVRLLGRISETGGALVGEALALREAGQPGAALDRVAARLDSLDPADAPAVLAFAAGLAEEAGLPGDALTLRRRLVEDHPRSPEAPGALLALALALSEEPDTRPEARELLERLIIEYPRSALVPRARQALSRLRQEGVA